MKKGSLMFLYAASLAISGASAYEVSPFQATQSPLFGAACCASGQTSKCTGSQVCCTVKDSLPCSSTLTMYCAKPSDCAS